jgi:hypothetical protein
MTVSEKPEQLNITDKTVILLMSLTLVYNLLYGVIKWIKRMKVPTNGIVT